MGRLRGAFVSWIPFHGRSQGFVDAFELTPIYASYLGMERPWLAPLKYIPQAIKTLCELHRARPEVVFVMDPPVFAVAAVSLYCAQSGARFVMDCHSGVFRGLKWRWSVPLQRAYARRAAAVIVTNPVDLATVTVWGATGVIMGDAPLTAVAAAAEAAPAAARRGGASVFVIVRFASDEPVGEILDAARRAPDVEFHISGDTRRARPAWLRDPPPNVRFTGWLSQEDFWTEVRRANAVLALTTEENTILQAGWEAMFAGQPLITSNTQALRNYFRRGTTFVDNRAEGIAAGIQRALAREPELRHEMAALRSEESRAWTEGRHQLEHLLGVEFDGAQRRSA